MSDLHASGVDLRVHTENDLFEAGMRALIRSMTTDPAHRIRGRGTSIAVIDADTCNPDDILANPENGPGAILVLSPHHCLEPLRRHLGTTVCAVLAPTFTGAEFGTALQTVIAGGLYVHAAFVPVVRFGPTAAATGRAASLTSRERQVHTALCRAQSNQQIADALGVSLRTVRFHVSNILRKLDLRTRAHIIAAHGPAGGTR